MLIILTVFLFTFTSIVMLVLRIVRPKLSIQGFLVVMAILGGLAMVLLAKKEIPTSITLLHWAPQDLFSVSPSIMIDEISWLLALALISLAAVIVISSIAKLGWSVNTETSSDQGDNQIHVVETASASELTSKQEYSEISMPNWLFWIIVLVMTSLGILAVTAGNILTLLLAWTALDFIEVAILLGSLLQSEDREKVAVIFSAKLGSTVMLIVAGLVLWSKSSSFDYAAMSASISILFIFPAAIRLGVLPPMIPYSHHLKLHQELSNLLFLVPASTCYILLVRAASVGASGVIIPILLALTAVVGLVSAIQWLTAPIENNKSRFWLVASGSLVIISAILKLPSSCLAWSLAGLLSGGLVFSFSLRHRNLIPIIIIGIFNLSALPFSPTWQTTTLYNMEQQFSFSQLIGILTLIGAFIIQSLLLAGLIRHLLGGFSQSMTDKTKHIERWVWVVYPVGLVIITLTHLLVGSFILPILTDLPFTAWIIGPLILLIGGLFSYGSSRIASQTDFIVRLSNTTTLRRIFTNDWLYNAVWQFYRSVGLLSRLISTIMEGEGGIIWALVLFGLIFVFLQR